MEISSSLKKKFNYEPKYVKSIDELGSKDFINDSDYEDSENFINEQQFSNVDENPMRSCTGDKNSSMTSARVIKPFHFKSHIEIQSPLMKDLKSPKKKEEDSFKCVKKELFRDSSPESLNSQELLNDIKEN